MHTSKRLQLVCAVTQCAGGIVSVGVCVHKFSTNRMGTFLESADILASHHKFKGLFEGSDVVLRVRLQLGLG